VRKVLEYKLLEINDYTITVYDLLSIILLFTLIQLLILGTNVVMKRALSRRREADQGKRYTMMKLIRYFLYTIGIVMSLQIVGVNITAVLVGSAALLVGIGLGLQDIFKDLVSGFIILFEGVIRVGHVIELDGMVARVMGIDIRTTKVVTRDGIYIIVPNSKITSQNLINWSLEKDITRFHIDVGVAYGSDTERVQEILIECAMNHRTALNDHPIRADFMKFGDSSLEFRLYFWAHRSWEIEIDRSDLRISIDKAFRENNIKIPFPQRELHINQ
jgi:small-conductance mechanosensitive channel